MCRGESFQMPASAPKANYGIDAPTVVLRLLIFGLGALLLGVAGWLAPRHGLISWLHLLKGPGMWMGGSFLLGAAVMVWGSKIGKLRLRDRVIASIAWRGDETVLDVGCGHGLMLIAAARRLTTGTAVGVDSWQKVDQAGNCREATLQNVQLEQVAKKVTLKDGDARKLEFDGHAFDIVLSSWAIHNIDDAIDRECAIQEMVRVLKPGGRLVIVDIQQIQQYASVLRNCGMQKIFISRPHLLFVIPSFILMAEKPAV